MTLILGIDPGLSGALAALTSLGVLRVEDMPVLEIRRGKSNKREINPTYLAALVREFAPTHAVVERVGAMPGQGVTSMFSFGRSVGSVEGVLAALNIPITYVTPQKWKRWAGVPAGKDAARLRASQLLPAYGECWRRKRDDGRAEASLIALWGLTNMPMLTAAASV